ncbi:MAG: hypothetical protein GF313_09110 [Caldithrix sp.]|nr:hypothetical protein [Caldithrix sp.]
MNSVTVLLKLRSKTKPCFKLTMEEEQILDELIKLMEKMSMIVKYDRGHFKGGMVRYKDQDFFYINRKTDKREQIRTIVNELKQITVPENLKTHSINEIFNMFNSEV